MLRWWLTELPANFEVEMSAETFVYGYIGLDSVHRDQNKCLFVHHPFDDLYPFPNIFSDIRPGYGCDMISFAGSLKSLDEDWNEWQTRFENLLFLLFVRSARVHLEHESDGMVQSVGYLCKEGWEATIPLAHRSWTKWYYSVDGLAGAAVPVCPG